MAQRRWFVPFTKVDVEKREVSGRLTQEVVDRDGEIWDYDASVPHIKAWSDSFKKATDGKSLGNLRAMHRPISAGKLVGIDFNDTEKAIDIVTKIVDDDEWNKVDEGLYTGFSLGGSVVRSWRAAGEKHKRFEVRPNEASLADYPCVPTAVFDYVKIGGLVETRHFNKIIDAADASDERTVTMKFADDANKRFPIATPLQTRVSLALWGKTTIRERYSADEQAAIAAQLVTAAEEHRIPEISAKTMASGDFTKGLYDVGRLAEAIQSLTWLQQCAASEKAMEGDDSSVPSAMSTAIAQLCDTLGLMVGEETDELLAMLGYEKSGESIKVAAGDPAKPEAGTATKVDVAAAPSAASTADQVAEPAEKIVPVEKIATGAFTKAMAKKHVATLNDLVDHAKAVHTMLGDHVEKMAGFCKDMGTDDDETSEKVAASEFAKVAGERTEWQKLAQKLETDFAEATAKIAATEAERDAFQKTAVELAEVGARLTDAIATRKGSLLAIDRTADGVTALSTASTESTEKVAGAEKGETPAGEVDRPALHSAFKKSFQNPGLPTPRRALAGT